MLEVGLDPKTRHRYPHEFSGGQRQRIAIARAMALKPKLVVLDEPTSALDRTVQVQIVELLKSLQKKHKMAYIFISHDLKVIRSMSHRIIVMKDGNIVEAGDAKKIYNNPQNSYTKSLLQSLN
jgi:microcin C transport system ATP-binding protein